MDSPLHRLLLVRAGKTFVDRSSRCIGSTDPQLSPAGRGQMRALERRWEWAERCVSSTLRRAWESARILAPSQAVRLDPRFRARHYGAWEGLTFTEIAERDPEASGADPDIPGAESLAEFEARVRAGFQALLYGPHRSVVVVTHLDVIRWIAGTLDVEPLPEGRPEMGEMLLLTRPSGGAWRRGRRSSMPPLLSTTFEREGLRRASDVPSHVGEFELQ